MEEVPFEDRHVPCVEIQWDRSAWFWYPLTRSIHPAMRMFSLALSLIAVLLAQAGWWLGGWLFLSANPPTSARSLPTYSWEWFAWLREHGLDWLAIERVDIRQLAFASFELVWLTAVFALLGGVIARRGAVELGQRTIAAWGESFRIVFSRWQSYLWSTGMHLVAIAAMLVPIALLGCLTRLGPLAAGVAGVLLLLLFPLVFGIGRFALSSVVCFPLSVCAISLEKKADAFEGFSRSNAYFFQRPVVGAVCICLLLVIGLVGEQIVFWTLQAGWWFVSRTFIAAGGEQAADSRYLAAGGWLVHALISAYWFSFFWTAAAAVYLILRKSVDHTELDEMECITSPIEQSLPEIPTSPAPATADAEDSVAATQTDGPAADPPESA